ncbi:MAG: hypothetical protein OEZ58_23705 [Gammaproteobacteria bacterium]|nr:hypothetical protein [Gammaproteobacteria bacterium]
MRIITLLLLIIISISYTGNVYSTEKRRKDIQIVRIHPMAANRPGSPNTQDITRIYVDTAPWENSSCRQDAADLMKVDTHLLSSLLMAWSTNKKISIIVDDALTPADTVCQVVALFIE